MSYTVGKLNYNYFTIMTARQKQTIKNTINRGLKKYKKSYDMLEQYDKKPEKAPEIVADERSLRERIQGITN